MSTQPETSRDRAPLTRERILRAAVDLADRDGLMALTMRNLAHDLGVEAMSLYYHVENKEALLDGVVETVVAEINDEVGPIAPDEVRADWKKVMRNRILEARKVLLRHRWAPELIEQHSVMSPAIMTYFEEMLMILREGGFSYDLAHHALHALGSRALGFTQELFQPDDASEQDVTEEMMMRMAESLPYLVGMMSEIVHDDPDSTIGWCDDQSEFEFGLDLLLDGLEQRQLSA